MEKETQKSLSGGTICRRIWNWSIMIILWCSIFYFTIVMSAGMRDQNVGAIVTLVFAYIGYMITACCSPTCSYLNNKHKSESIHENMKNLYYTAPQISFHIECYHYETRYRTVRDSNGNTRSETYSERVTTYRGSEQFRYYSWRDVSGLFLLDSHKVFRSTKKTYIKLNLKHEIDLADDITRMDYQIQKDFFYNRNRWRDVHCTFWETKIIPGLNKYNMVRISNNHPAFVNLGTYLFFTFILPTVEFYKIYVNQFCIDQQYTIKKLISTRFNLNAEERHAEYVQFMPAILIFEQPKEIYNQTPTPLHDDVTLPTFDDLEEAKKYNHINIGGSELTESYQPMFNDKTQENQNYNQNVPMTPLTYNGIGVPTQGDLNIQVNANQGNFQHTNGDGLKDRLL